MAVFQTNENGRALSQYRCRYLRYSRMRYVLWGVSALLFLAGLYFGWEHDGLSVLMRDGFDFSKLDHYDFYAAAWLLLFWAFKPRMIRKERGQGVYEAYECRILPKSDN